jgi:hypothetical protein
VGVAAESGTSMVTLEEMMRTNNHSAITYLKVKENSFPDIYKIQEYETIFRSLFDTNDASDVSRFRVSNADLSLKFQEQCLLLA